MASRANQGPRQTASRASAPDEAAETPDKHLPAQADTRRETPRLPLQPEGGHDQKRQRKADDGRTCGHEQLGGHRVAPVEGAHIAHGSLALGVGHQVTISFFFL